MISKVLWFTGLSGSGKSTIAIQVSKNLKIKNYKVKILDGDEIRETINLHLGFTPKDIRRNNRVIANICLNLISQYHFIFVPIISPFQDTRKVAKEIIGQSFVEIYIKSKLSTVINRDVKGLYSKAVNGEIKNFIGIAPEVPYKPPKTPALTLDTDKETVDQSVQKMLHFLENEHLYK